VETERQYVHHLLNLQALKKELEEIGALTGDSIHNIFLNLNNLLDFAQRFLIRIEQHNELPEEAQNWGELFIHYKEPFGQYEPFIANQRRCEATCQKEWDKMVAASRSALMGQMLANPTILNGFLLKPMVRLTKYPLLLKVSIRFHNSQVRVSDRVFRIFKAKLKIKSSKKIWLARLKSYRASYSKRIRRLQEKSEKMPSWISAIVLRTGNPCEWIPLVI